VPGREDSDRKVIKVLEATLPLDSAACQHLLGALTKVGSRDLAVEDAGPDSGFPILMMNGVGSRHLFPSAVRECQEQRFRLIGYDRPGCGGSTRLPGRRIADCAADVRAIMSDLGISRAAVWGSSGGAPHALAAAATLPEMVAAACVFGSIGPYGEPGLDWAEGLGGDEAREEIRIFFEEPERARADFRARSAVTLAERGSPDWWMQIWGEQAGQDAAHSREWADYLAMCFRDVLHACDDGSFDDDGSWEDDSALYYPWQFDLAEIKAPVSLWHGLKDFIRSPTPTGSSTVSPQCRHPLSPASQGHDDGTLRPPDRGCRAPLAPPPRQRPRITMAARMCARSVQPVLPARSGERAGRVGPGLPAPVQVGGALAGGVGLSGDRAGFVEVLDRPGDLDVYQAGFVADRLPGVDVAGRLANVVTRPDDLPGAEDLPAAGQVVGVHLASVPV
jgi:pimeloyl-ACP methyl ester carboxylesterase